MQPPSLPCTTRGLVKSLKGLLTAHLGDLGTDSQGTAAFTLPKKPIDVLSQEETGADCRAGNTQGHRCVLNISVAEDGAGDLDI